MIQQKTANSLEIELVGEVAGIFRNNFVSQKNSNKIS